MRSIDLIAAHLIGDFCLQTDEMATKKLTDPAIRAAHVFRYHVPFLIAGIATRQSLVPLAAFLVLSGAAHFITDSKRWIPNEDWPPGVILNDQALHAVQLAILGRLLDRGGA